MNTHHFPSLDQLDMRLIAELELNAKQTNKAIAVKLGVDRSTIMSRFKRLVDSGVISTYCWVDPIALGYHFRVAFAIYTHAGQESEVADRLAANPRISIVLLCTGRRNVTAWAMFRTGADISYFLSNELKPIPGILHVETTLTLQEVKVRIGLVAEDIKPHN